MIETELREGQVFELQPEDVGELPDTTFAPTETPKLEAASTKVRLIMFTLGVSSLLPWNIVLNAAGFYQARLKGTMFQDNFSYYLQATAIFANLLGGFCSLYINKKFDTRKVALISNITMTSPLIVMTVLAKMDTTGWQETFYIINLAAFTTNAASHGVSTSCQSALCTMISPTLIKDYYLGKGLAGLTASALTLITLSVPSLSAETATFYYFLATTLITFVGMTILIFYFINLPKVKAKTKAKNYESHDNSADRVETSSLLMILKKIQVQCYSALLLTITTLLVFPAIITNLKPITESDPPTEWTEKYFLPVTVYLVFSLGDFIGKFASNYVTWPTRELVVWFSLGRVLLVPLVLMTNIQPRTIPVWFQSDVIPGILSFLIASSGGFLMNLVLAYAPTYIEAAQDQGKASMIVFAFISLGLALGSAFIFVVPYILNAA